MDKWEVLKEKVAEMSNAMMAFDNNEARKAYDHILQFMKVCEESNEAQ